MLEEIRRKDRALTSRDALTLLGRAEFGILSTVSPDGKPYGIPMNFCMIGEDIYFHSAGEGRKLENIASCSTVSFCVVGNTEVLPDKFGTKYESAVVTGKAEEVFGSEKQRGLEGLLLKYSPGFITEGRKFIDKASHKTRVFRIHMESISGKARK